MARLGHCARCGKAVELLPDGSCPRGHGTSEIAYSWDAGARHSLVKRWGLPAVIAVVAGWILFAAAAVVVLTASRDIKPKTASGLKLGRSAATTRWRYVALEATRAPTIKDALGNEVSAGRGYDFVLVRMSATNRSRHPEHIGWSFDDQPVLEWHGRPTARASSSEDRQGQGVMERLRSAVGLSPSSGETYYFEEYEGYSDIRPGRTEIAWLVFRVPSKRAGFLLKLEGNTWSLGL